MPKRVISEKELTACYGLMFSEYPDIVNIRQLQAMQVIGRVAADPQHGLLGEGEIGCIKLGNTYKIPKINVIRYVLEASAARAERVSHVAPPVPSQGAAS